MSFFSALFDPAMPFVRNALLAGILSSILFGVLGSVVTVKRIAGLAGAISHAVLGGIGLALFLAAKGIMPGLPPIAGALVFAIIAAALIGFVSLKAKQREDTVINALWAIGMSIGIVFIAKTPGYADPMSYLFGNILLVSTSDLILLGILDLVVILLAWRYYPQIEASAFDEEFARTRGPRCQHRRGLPRHPRRHRHRRRSPPDLRRHRHGHRHAHPSRRHLRFFREKPRGDDGIGDNFLIGLFGRWSHRQLEPRSALGSRRRPRGGRDLSHRFGPQSAPKNLGEAGL